MQRLCVRSHCVKKPTVETIVLPWFKWHSKCLRPGRAVCVAYLFIHCAGICFMFLQFIHSPITMWSHAAIATASCNSASTLACVYVMSCRDVFILYVCVCVFLPVCMCCSCALSSTRWCCQLDHLLLCLPDTLEPGAQTPLSRTALLWSAGGGGKHDRGPFDYRCLIRTNLRTHRDGLHVPHGKMLR